MKDKKQIKRYASYLLTIMLILTVIGCGKKDSQNDTDKIANEIIINTQEQTELALTAENYNDYLNLSIYCTEGGEPITLNEPIALAPDYAQGFAYPSITGFLSTQTASSEIRFEDVSVKIEITGTYKACSIANVAETAEDTFQLTIETPIDASGEVLKSTDFELPEGYATITSYISYEYEIVDISGYVIK